MRTKHASLVALGANVRRHRHRKSLTQEVLAASADLDPTYISGIERGVRNPSILSVVRIANALGTTVSSLSKGINSRIRDKLNKIRQ
ncbi:MAG: helix-turn-helix domain-containing protein [Rudaea sp.]